MKRLNARLTRIVLCTALLLVLAPLAPGFARAEDEAPTLDQLKAGVEGDGSGRARSDAAEAIAEHHFEPETLVPWLNARLEAEGDFHVRLALAYALAAQGEVNGLDVLIDSLKRMGHLGYVYLERVSGQRIGGPGVGWDRPGWLKWRNNLDPDAYRERHVKRNMPRGATDGDLKGLRAAVTWFDTLKLLDVKKRPWIEVRALRGDAGKDVIMHGFLLSSDRKAFTVLGTDLRETTFLREKRASDDRAPGSTSARFKKADLAKWTKTQLDVLAGKGEQSIDTMMADPFGVHFYLTPRREQGLTVAAALMKLGKRDLAMEVWKILAESSRGAPRYGEWKTLELAKADLAQARLRGWHQTLLDPAASWQSVHAQYEAWHARFGTDENGSAETLQLLARMAQEGSSYEAALKQSKTATGAAKAKLLVKALPLSRNARPSEDAGMERALADLGADAVPTLIKALDDERFTREAAYSHGFKAYIRTTQWPVRVSGIALRVLRDISGEPLQGRTREATRKAAEAWWAMFREKGEEAVLIEGVEKVNGASVGHARRLVSKYPSSAFEPIREAIELTEGESRVSPALMSTLHALKTKEAREFLLEQAEYGDLQNRIAASRALLEHGTTKGVELLTEVWPEDAAVDLEIEGALVLAGFETAPKLIETLLVPAPKIGLAHMVSVLDETGPRLIAEVVRALDLILGSGAPTEGEGAWTDPAAHVLAETFLARAAMTPPERARDAGGEQGEEPATESEIAVAEQAARVLARGWPKLYTFDPEAAPKLREEQRLAIINGWRSKNDLAPLAKPKPVQVKAVSPAEVRKRVKAWQDASDKEGAEKAILELGLGALPHLKILGGESLPAKAKEGIARITRRLARTVRKVSWRSGEIEPSAAIKKRAQSIKGRPITGKDITLLLRASKVDRPEGATGITLTLSRPGDGTGFVLTLGFTTHLVPWPGARGGTILSDGGSELVDTDFLRDTSSWWHEARSEQLDERLDKDPEARVSVDLSFVSAE